MSWEEAAQTFSVSTSSVGRFVKQHRKEKEREEKIELGEELEPPPKRRKCGRKNKLSPDILVWILEKYEEDAAITTKNLVQEIEKEWNLKVSPSTLDKELDKLALTWKMCLSIPDRWNSEEVILARQVYVQQKLTSIMDRPVVYLDECPFNLHVKHKKARAVKGSTPKLSLLPKGTI